MTESATIVKLHTVKAKIDSILSADDKRKSYRIIPLVEEMSQILENAQTPSAETLEKSAGYYMHLGSCYEKLPFYPHAIRCYTRAFTRFKRAYEEFGSKSHPEELSFLYYRIAFLRNCTAKDLGKAEPDLCSELTPTVKNLVGDDTCRELFKNALTDSARAPRICPSGHTPQFFNCLYEIEVKADRKLSQVDSALVSKSSLDSIKTRLFAECGIVWTPSCVKK